MPQEKQPKKLRDQRRDVVHTHQDSIRTEEADVDGARRLLLWHPTRHPTERGTADIDALLTHVAVERHVAASTQHPALSALLCLDKAVLHQAVESGDAVRARQPKRLPTVLTTTAARRVLRLWWACRT